MLVQIAAALLLIVGSLGMTPVAAAERPAPPPHESPPTGPWILPAHEIAARPVTPRRTFTRDGYLSVQVNVDAFGANILGDAANEPSFAIDPTAPNRLVVGWRQFDSVASNFRQAGWGYSHDGGRTWAFPGVLVPGEFRSDPVLGVNHDGAFYYHSLAINPYRCYMHRSDDAGASWSNSVYAYGGDKAWFAIDRTRGAAADSIYTYWAFPTHGFNWSRDGGLSFAEPIPLPVLIRWGSITVGVDGEVYLVGGYDTAFLISRVWNAQHPEETPEFDLSRDTGLGGAPRSYGGPNPGGMLGQAWIAADHSDGPTRGNVYVACAADRYGDDPLDIMFNRSEDRGDTWADPPVRINDDPPHPDAWQWFAAMSVAPNGRIDVVWYDTRNSLQTNICELYYAYSTDAGASWSTNIAVSPPFDSWVGWPNQNKIGDYIQCHSDRTGVDVIYAATFNGEQDVYYLRIGPRDCNENGIPDAEDIAGGFSADCNSNGIPDTCELAAGTATDGDGDGVLDECQHDCPGDVDGDNDIDQADLGLLLVAYERPPDDPLYDPRADFTGDALIDQQDLGILLANYETICD
ncbi:MAG: hypothetical protein ACF8NJ_02075 [Phycisphaerales bacterium JB038]